MDENDDRGEIVRAVFISVVCSAAAAFAEWGVQYLREKAEKTDEPTPAQSIVISMPGKSKKKRKK